MATNRSLRGGVPDGSDRRPEIGVARRIPRENSADPATLRLRRLEKLAWLLDRSIPVGNYRIGLDPILGLLPGVGDSIGALLSLYVLYEGARLGAPRTVLFRMLGNILVETVIGAVPLLGDAFDFVWQANTRNMRLIHRYHAPDWQPRSLGSVWVSMAIAAIVVLAVVIALAWTLIAAVAGWAERVW